MLYLGRWCLIRLLVKHTNDGEILILGALRSPGVKSGLFLIRSLVKNTSNGGNIWDLKDTRDREIPAFYSTVSKVQQQRGKSPVLIRLLVKNTNGA